MLYTHIGAQANQPEIAAGLFSAVFASPFVDSYSGGPPWSSQHTVIASLPHTTYQAYTPLSGMTAKCTSHILRAAPPDFSVELPSEGHPFGVYQQDGPIHISCIARYGPVTILEAICNKSNNGELHLTGTKYWWAWLGFRVCLPAFQHSLGWQCVEALSPVPLDESAMNLLLAKQYPELLGNMYGKNCTVQQCCLCPEVCVVQPKEFYLLL